MSKKKFFDQLHALETADEHQQQQQQRQQQQQQQQSQEGLSLSAVFCSQRHLGQTNEFVLKRAHTTNLNFPSVIPSSKLVITKPRALVCTNTVPEKKQSHISQMVKRSTSGPVPPANKRKKVVKGSFELVPEEQRVFRDCVFYFIRNDEISAERRMRHNKAREYGASVVNIFDEKITHVIIDKDLAYHNVLKLLEIESIPSHASVVKQQFIADCIRYRRVLEADQILYRVNGQPVNAVEQTVARSASPECEHEAPVEKVVEAPKTVEPSLSVRSEEIARHLENVKSNIAVADVSKPDKATTNTDDDSADSMDELSSIIQYVKIENPLDANEFIDEDGSDDETTSKEAIQDNIEASDYDSDAAEEARKTAVSLRTHQRKTDSQSWQSAFKCMHKNDGQTAAKNPNERTWKVLEEMRKHYESTGDVWRPRAYRFAVNALKKETVKVTTYEQAMKLYQVGDRLSKKIVEIVTTDRLRRLEYAKLEPSDQLIELFKGIYGIGLVHAQKLINLGYTTLEGLATYPGLTENQKIGIEHYEDFKQRIPREEVAQHGKVVQDTASKIDKEVQTQVMGSYLRGAPTCGDIDIIITKKGANVLELKGILDRLVEDLFNQGFLMCGLAVARDKDGTQWHGASKVGTVWRRIDLLLVPPEEMGAALLYFTGDDVFNRSLRLLASKKGMRLNQRGLYKDVMRGKSREKFNGGTLVEQKSEEGIFTALGVPWRPPNHRICQ